MQEQKSRLVAIDDPMPKEELELIITFEGTKGQKEMNWFKLSRKERRSIKTKAPALYAKIDAVAKQMLKEQKEATNEEV